MGGYIGNLPLADLTRGQKGWVYGTIREAVGFQILIIGAREPDSEARIGAREQDSEAQVRYINAL